MADFSINAIRRLKLLKGKDMVIELPADRLMAFDRPEVD
jgi:iron(III) transport system ATP-binding protein